MRPKKDDPMQQFTPEARIESYLKKDIDLEGVRASDRQLSQEESKRLAREQVLRKQSVFQGNRWESFKDRARRHFFWRMKLLRFKGIKRFSYETLPLILFATFALVVAWRMEDRLDVMKRR